MFLSRIFIFIFLIFSLVKIYFILFIICFGINTKMKCLVCGNEIPENESECPSCISFIDTLNFLTSTHFDELNLPNTLKVPGLLAHIFEMLKMSYEDLINNLDTLSKKGLELINLEKDTEVKNTARNFFQFFIDFITSREARFTYGREVVDSYGLKILNEFCNSELEIIIEMNSQKITEVNELIKQKSYLPAAHLLKKHADYLKSIGKDEIGEQVLTKSLDILLDGLEFEKFFEIFNDLSLGMKLRYLTRIFPKYIQKLEQFKNVNNKSQKEKILENSIRIYRDHLLYAQSNEIGSLFMKKERENI